MPKRIGELFYSPGQVAEWFNISRSTLFRWEREGLIEKPDRGARGERIYHRYHLENISDFIKRKMRADIDRQFEESSDSPIPSMETLEQLYKLEAFCSDDPEHGLKQLKGLASGNGLSQATCNTLLEEIRIRPKGDAARSEMLRILLADGEAGQ